MPVRKRLLPESSPKKAAQFSEPPKPTEINVEPRLMKISRAAKYLNTSIWAVRQLLYDKKLKPVRLLSRVIFIDRADLDALIEKLKAA